MNIVIYFLFGVSVGIGFVIFVDMVCRVVNELIRKGKVLRLGLGIMCVSDS